MRVLFLVPYPEGEAPGQRLKFERQFAYFRSQGVTVDVKPFFTPEAYRILYKPGHYAAKAAHTLRGLMRRWGELWSARDYDLVYIFLYAAPVGPPVYEWVLKHLLKVPFVYDLDDANFLPNASSANRFAAWIKWPGKIKEIIPWAEQVIVGTPHLAELFKPLNAHITYTPPVIDTDVFYAKPLRPAGEPVVVGWSGSHSTSQYLQLIAPALARLAQRPDVRLKVIGDAKFSLPGVPIEAIPWQEATEVQDLADFDIGLYPLPRDPWVLGKGGGKALQYMGMGIPPVCTPYGVHTQFIETGVHGYFAETADEWYETVVTLVENPELRRQVGLRGRRLIEQRFSVKALSPVYYGVLQQALGGGAPEAPAVAGS